MGPTGPSGKNRMASYADALRGHKLFDPEPKSADEVKAVAAYAQRPVPAPTDGPNTAQNVAKKTSQTKGTKSTQKKSQKPDSTAVRESAFQAGPGSKGSHPRSSNSKARAAAKQPAKPSFSYAEAVKGKPSPVTPRPKNAQASQEIQAVACPSTQATVSRSRPKASSRLELMDDDNGDLRDIDKLTDGHDATQWHRDMDMMGVPYHTDMISKHLSHYNYNAMTIPTHGRDKQWRESELERSYKQQSRRFSAGDVSSARSNTVFFTPSATFIQLSQLSAPSSATFIMLLPGESIDDAIARIIETEKKRVKMLEEREERLRDLIAANDRRELSLWDTKEEWDVLVKCGDRTWKVHRDILCRESNWFKTRMPPKNPDGSYVTFDCNGHNTTQLTHALHYMYDDRSAKKHMKLEYALSGFPIQVAVYTYIAGASVGFERMTADAQCALYEMALQLTMFFHDAHPAAVLRLEMSGLYAPLRTALAMSFDQADAGVTLLGLRAVLAHLCDVLMMWLVLDLGFCADMEKYWFPDLWLNVMLDHRYFERNGLLDEMWEILIDAIPVRKRRGAKALQARPGDSANRSPSGSR
ncbi:hypothetical protein B0I37DRAFT_23863 [Chaetomium sp. MPI-CAGE-AT-0009]|nr:hypothetical protein B0I37DRAFT_23863 [Chaetomium sp. MPI-CAGE-AT-0009]